MKPTLDTLAICTATVDPLRAHECFLSWSTHARYHLPVYVVWSVLPPYPAPTTSKQRRELDALNDGGGKAILSSFAPGVTILTHHGGGVVPAFAQGVAAAFEEGAEIIAALHDDIELLEPDWDLIVANWFHTHPKCLLLGFGGGRGLGAADIYHTPYDPMQLARQDFVSNMRDAEAHGRRVGKPTRVACLDGMSLIGRADFLHRSYQHLRQMGVVHHCYDSHMGVLAAREGGEVWMLPLSVHHHGGTTAVGSEAYGQWARAQHADGDQHFWQEAHRLCYEDARGVLPLRVP